MACTIVRPVMIFTGRAPMPIAGGRYRSIGVSTTPPPMPSSPDRNEATSADSAVTNSLPYAVGMRSPLYRCCCGSCWSRLPDLPTPPHGIGVVAVGGTVYVMSGGPTPGGSQTPVSEALDLPAQ